jgi:hypothetical protein
MAVVITLAACGDDDRATDTVAPSSTAPAAGSASDADQPAAEASLLRLSDFPSGWTAQPAESRTDAQDEANRKLASCAGVSGTSMIDFGGALARSDDFASGSQTDQVNSVVAVAASADDARKRIADLGAPAVATCMHDVYEAALEDALSSEDVTVGDLTVARLNVAPAGDEDIAFRITVPVEQNGAAAGTVFVDLVAVRVGRGVSGLMAQAQDSPMTSDDTDRLVGITADRMKAQGL